jgi:hypothetical protein
MSPATFLTFESTFVGLFFDEADFLLEPAPARFVPPFAADFFADFFAPPFFAEDLAAPPFFAPDFFEADLPAADFFVDFFADFFDAPPELFFDDFLAADFFDADFFDADFFDADFLPPPDFLADFFDEDLLVAICPSPSDAFCDYGRNLSDNGAAVINFVSRGHSCLAACRAGPLPTATRHSRRRDSAFDDGDAFGPLRDITRAEPRRAPSAPGAAASPPSLLPRGRPATAAESPARTG